MKRKKYAYASLTPVACLVFLASCGENVATPGIDAGSPIVECYLEEGKNTLNVKLYTMEVYLGDDYVLSKPIGGLRLQVNERELQETSPGTYSLDLGADTIRSLEEYHLEFEYEGKIIRASTSVPRPVENLRIEPSQLTRTYASYYWGGEEDSTEIVVSWDDPDGSFYQIYVVSPSSSTVNTPSGPVFGRRMMQPFQGNRYVMRPMDFPVAGYYSIYLYRVNKDYADLYERVSSTDLANPVSSIDNALGIFTSMSVALAGFSLVEE
jgi:hypothetical protein